MKVSVLMITYNHEQFIAQALDSILNQDTCFEYEIVIGEDCSTDGTREILLSYQKLHPDKIRLLLPEKNLGMMANFIQTYAACRGDYVALLEGDDYWTSPHKLQQQADYLDNHPECAECFHNVEVVDDRYPENNYLFSSQKTLTFYNLEDIVASNVISTCSAMFRAKHISKFPDWFMSMPMGDWPLHVLNAEKGTLAFLPETMAAYRVHDGGVWSRSSRMAILKKSLVAIEVINKHLEYRYRRIVDRTKRRWERESTSLMLESREYRNALQLAVSSFSNQPTHQYIFLVKTCIQIVSRILKESFMAKRHDAK